MHEKLDRGALVLRDLHFNGNRDKKGQQPPSYNYLRLDWKLLPSYLCTGHLNMDRHVRDFASITPILRAMPTLAVLCEVIRLSNLMCDCINKLLFLSCENRCWLLTDMSDWHNHTVGRLTCSTNRSQLKVLVYIVAKNCIMFSSNNNSSQIIESVDMFVVCIYYLLDLVSFYIINSSLTFLRSKNRPR